MDRKILLLAVFAVLFLSVYSNGASAAGNGNCTGANYASQGGGNFSVPPSGDNWTINTTVVCSQVFLNLTNLTITSTGSLYLNKSVIIFNISSNAPLQHGVNVSGSLYLNNGTNITTNRSDYGFSLFFYSGSSGWINNSNVSYLQNHTGWGSNGISVNTSSVVITNSVIASSKGYGLNIVGGSPVVNNTTIENNFGGVLVANSTPTLVNLTIKLATDAAFNATYANSTIFSNNTLINNTFGLVFSNTNITLTQLQVNNSTYGFFARNASLVTLVDSNLTETRTNSGFANATAVLFNVTSNSSNATFVNVNYDNYSFVGNSTASLAVNWYIDIYVRSSLNNTLVSGATLYTNNTTTWISATTNASGTLARRNLTEHIFFVSNQSLAVLNTTYYNYTIQAIKGNSTNTTWTNLTSNKIDGSNITVQLNLVTVTVNAKGTGAAAGYSIQNALVTLTNGSLSFTENTSGIGIANFTVPYGEYNVSVTHGNFSNGQTVSNSIIGYNYTTLNASSSNFTANITMFPRINITGNYSCTGGGYSPFNFTSTSCNAGISSGVPMLYNGTARYAHSNGAVNGTIYVSSTQSDFVSSSYVNLTSGGNFQMAKTAPSPSSTTNYTVTFWVNDSSTNSTHGNNGSSSWGVQVTVASNATGTTAGTGGAAGGGGGTGDYALTITEYTRQLVIAQSESKEVTLIVKNTGVKSLAGVQLTIAGISSDWYKVNVSLTGGSTKDLVASEAVTFNVKFTIPSSALPQIYKATWRVRDRDALALAEKDLNLTITQVWTSSRVDVLKKSIAEVDIVMADIWKNITALKATGLNVSELEANFKALNSTLALAKLELDSSDYSSAQNDLNRVKADIATLVAAVASAKPKGVAQILRGELAKPLGMAIFAIIIGAAVAGGLFLWWKFLRVVSLAEIRKHPDKFVHGARVQGVIKSITDTQKGKVFLIADNSGEKLHVRYPFYTTSEVGDLIRVSGVVKKYKDVPYMDAAELQRLTTKPSA